MKFILGQKIGMSQLFSENGQMIPVTLIEAGPCYVLSRLQSPDKVEDSRGNRSNRGSSMAKPSGQKNGKDGYEAIQIGFKKLKESKVKHTQKQKPYKYIKEFRGDINISKYKIGDKIDLSVFKEGDAVKISGISKGKGFAGAVKRWGFKERGASHGIKHEHRTIGSTGSRFPQRVIKGRRMPGRMGGERITVKNLKIMKVDIENNLIAVKGAVPGRKGTLLEIRG